jgi:hypothetical protein
MGANRPYSYDGPKSAPISHSKDCTIILKADGVDGCRSRHLSAKVWLLSKRPLTRSHPRWISTIGLDRAPDSHAKDPQSEQREKDTLGECDLCAGGLVEG